MLRRPAGKSANAGTNGPHLAMMRKPRFEEWGPALAAQVGKNKPSVPAAAGRNPLASRDQGRLQQLLQQLTARKLPNQEVERLLKEVAFLNVDCTTIRDERLTQTMDKLEHRAGERAAAMCRRLKKRYEGTLAMQLREEEARKAAQTVVAHVYNRSLISKRKKEGMQSDDHRLYEGLVDVPDVPSKDLVKRYRDRQILSVKRSSEPTTVALQALCRIGRNRMLKAAKGSGTDAKSLQTAVKKATVLSIFVWRQLGGTVFLATKIGFIESWEPKDQKRVERISRSVREGIGKPLLKTLDAWHVEDQEEVRKVLRRYRPKFTEEALKGASLEESDFFTPGYLPPSFLHSAMYDLRAAEKKDAVQARDDFDIMLGDVIEMANRLCSKNVTHHAGEPVLDGILRIGGENLSFRDACYCVRGIFSEKAEHPKFVAKEFVQDLLDLDWIFPKGRKALLDLGLYSPFGPGGLKGVLKVLGRDPNEPNLLQYISQEEELALLQCIYEQVLKLQAKGQSVEIIEELHDLQYNFCEIFKILGKVNQWPRRGPSGTATKVQTFKRKADTTWGGNEPLAKRRAIFAAAKKKASA